MTYVPRPYEFRKFNGLWQRRPIDEDGKPTGRWQKYRYARFTRLIKKVGDGNRRDLFSPTHYTEGGFQ